MLLNDQSAVSDPLFDLAPDLDESPARRTLLAQIAHLDRSLSAAACEAFPDRIDLEQLRPSGPRIQNLGQLELLRDRLVDSLREARATLAARELERAEARELLERMLLDPAKHRRVRISQRELGVGGCGVWSVMPRLGPMGRLMGWWRVKLSSGCPLAT